MVVHEMKLLFSHKQHKYSS
jgi:hypothetical protein